MFDSNQELIDQISLGEDSVLEFKSIRFERGRVARLDSRVMADEVAAFANGMSGVIILGVDDSTHAVVGIPLDMLDVVENWARAFLNDSIYPPLEAYIRRIWLPGSDDVKKACIRIDVPEGMTVYRSPHGYYHRIGSSKRMLTTEELMRLFQRRGQTAIANFDEQILSDRPMEILRPDLFRRFKPAGASMCDEELLQKLKMVDRDASGILRPTVTGVLFATEAPEELLPNAYIQCVCYTGTERDAAYQADAHDITGPLDRQIKDACAFVRRNMRIRAHKCEGRIDYPQYDMTAVFEAVVNAVAHRDYSVRGAKIRLHMFADRLELVSPGSLPGTLTVEQMPYWQETRNEAICALLARCPMLAGVDGCTRKYLMDARGEGVPIIISRSEQISGKKAKYREIQGSGVMLTMPGFSDDFLTNSSENKGVSSEKTLVGERVLAMIAIDPSVTQLTIAKKLHCPRSTVAYWFKKLSDEGKIVRKGPDKGGHWLVKK